MRYFFRIFILSFFLFSLLTFCFMSCKDEADKQNAVNSLYSAAAAPPVTVIGPELIAQSPDYRFTTDFEKAKWNDAYNVTRITSIPAGTILQDPKNRFVTDIQIAQWNKTPTVTSPTNIPPTSIVVDANNRFVTDSQIRQWNKTSRLQNGMNVQLVAIDDSTISVNVSFRQLNTYDRDKWTAAPVGTIIINTDTDKLNIRLKQKWEALWSS